MNPNSRPYPVYQPGYNSGRGHSMSPYAYGYSPASSDAGTEAGADSTTYYSQPHYAPHAAADYYSSAATTSPKPQSASYHPPPYMPHQASSGGGHSKSHSGSGFHPTRHRGSGYHSGTSRGYHPPRAHSHGHSTYHSPSPSTHFVPPSSSHPQPAAASAATPSSPISSSSGAVPLTLQYNPYLAPGTSTSGIGPSRRRGIEPRATLFFMPDTLRAEYVRRASATIARYDGDDPRAKSLPAMVHRYHSLFPLDERAQVSKALGVPTSLFKVTSSVDGLVYTLRKIDGGFRPLLTGPGADAALATAVEQWRQITHPGVVALREAFVSKEFGDGNSLCFVYDFHPCAETLEARYMTSGGAAVPEGVVWSIVVQLATALRAIHSAGLACRTLIPSKVLVTGKNRVKINGVGMLDVLEGGAVNTAGKNMPLLYHEDIVALGRLVICLCCRSPMAAAPQNIAKSLEIITARYSRELKNLILYLRKPTALSPTSATPYASTSDLLALLAPRLVAEIDHLREFADALDYELSRETENGRLFRLVCKLGFINERPEQDMDPKWAETGDRYLLKLFRDYVFHQVYENGAPCLDLGHVVESLNRLDLGAEEKLVLMSRDERSMIVVSYKDLKRCAEGAFNELLEKSLKQVPADAPIAGETVGASGPSVAQ